MLIPTLIFGNLIFQIFKILRDHRRINKRMDEYSQFNYQMLAWADEITDMSVRTDYLVFCVEEFTLKSCDFNSKIQNRDLVKLKNEIIEKYSNHIPSLKQEVREKKLNKLLK